MRPQGVKRRGDGRIRANAFAKPVGNHVDTVELIGQVLSVGGPIEVQVDALVDRHKTFRQRWRRSTHGGGKRSDQYQYQ